MISNAHLSGAFNFLDATRFQDVELLGYRASAHATIANIHVESASKNKKESNNEYVIALREFTAAQNILNSEEFKRGQISESLANSSSQILEEKQYGSKNMGPMRFTPYYYTVNWLYRDSEKDLKTSIAIGMAKLKCLDPHDEENMTKGVTELEDIAYNMHGVSPDLKIQAKVELARSLAKYSVMAEEIRYKNPMLFNSYTTKAKKSLVIARELFATAYAYKAGQLMDELSKLIK